MNSRMTCCLGMHFFTVLLLLHNHAARACFLVTFSIHCFLSCTLENHAHALYYTSLCVSVALSLPCAHTHTHINTHTVLQMRTGEVHFELLSQVDKNRHSKEAILNIQSRVLSSSWLIVKSGLS